MFISGSNCIVSYNLPTRLLIYNINHQLDFFSNCERSLRHQSGLSCMSVAVDDEIVRELKYSDYWSNTGTILILLRSESQTMCSKLLRFQQGRNSASMVKIIYLLYLRMSSIEYGITIFLKKERDYCLLHVSFSGSECSYRKTQKHFSKRHIYVLSH